jgi:hypothetical protein
LSSSEGSIEKISAFIPVKKMEINMVNSEFSISEYSMYSETIMLVSLKT